MRVIKSNRTERLIDALAQALRDEPQSPLEPEVIVVQGNAMRRWLSLELASINQICAHTSFPSPRVLLDEMLDVVLDGEEDRARNQREAYRPDRLRWTIASILPTVATLPEELRDRLSKDRGGNAAVELSGHLAKALDRQLVYRPDEVLRWQRSDSGGWIAQVWREVHAKLGGHHLAERAERAETAVASVLRGEGATARERKSQLPKRLSLFAVETLPPIYVHLFGIFAKLVPTSLYLHRATPHYWGDERGAKARHETAGHPLLALCGRTSKEFDEILLNAALPVEEELDLFDKATADTRLGALQSALFESVADTSGSQTEIDASLAVHACPTRMRETQVVRDVIREALESDATLQPDDILIVTPGLDQYRALIQSVFDDGDTTSIPFQFADQQTLVAHEWVKAFLQITDFLASRWTRSELVDLLAIDALAQAFEFDASELDHARQLIAEAGVRWGIDASHREALGFPKDGTHCWRAGIDRLLFSYAVHPFELRSFNGTNPTHPRTRASAEVAARLASFVETLAAFWRHPSTTGTVQEWMRFFRKLATTVLSDELDHAGARSRFLACLRSVEQASSDHEFTSELVQSDALGVLRDSLRATPQRSASGSGGVTVAELSPFRCTPFRMICLMGMSARDFPRAATPRVFDFATGPSRLGDRDRRSDDLHAFVQTLICARDRVVISYSSELYDSDPSLAVATLLDTAAGALDDGVSPVIEHSLHPFEPRYFQPDASPPSYSTRMRDVARALSAPALDPPIHDALEVSDIAEVTAHELASALWHPTRAFYRDRLGVFLRPPSVADLEDDTLSPLDLWRTGTELLGRLELLTDKEADDWLAANPVFPSGVTGDMARARLGAEARQIADVMTTLDGRAGEHADARVVVDGVTIHAAVDGLQNGRRFVTSFSREARASELQAWIDHLVANTLKPVETVVVARQHLGAPTTIVFPPQSSPEALLRQAVLVHRHAMSRPIPLFSQASREYATRIRGGVGEEKALSYAAKRFHARGGDSDDPYVQRAFGDTDPFADADLASSFQTLALAVYLPWLESRARP